MNERFLATLSSGSAIASVSLQNVAHLVSIAAGICAVLAALPVIVDRWGPNVRRWLGRK
jgi:hypothetical protein